MAVNGSIWSGLVGHEAILRRLDGEARSERVTHAYLFAGPAGVGKTTTALGFAQRLSCQGDGPPCGRCEACRAISRRVPGVVRVLAPEEQAGSGAYRHRIHRIETIREIQADTALRGFGSGFRVYVLKTAEAMTEAAANCLLKTLEEPPPGVVLVLTAEQPAGLLPTVLSRVRRVDFAVVPTPAIDSWLQDQHGVDATTAGIAANTSAGRPARALLYAVDEQAREHRRAVVELIAGIDSRPSVAALTAAERLLGGESEEAGKVAGDSGEPAIELSIDILEWWYRDALIAWASGGATALVNADRAAEVSRFASAREFAELRSGLAALQQARMSLQRNGNARLVVEVLWLRLARGGRLTAAGGPPEGALV